MATSSMYVSSAIANETIRGRCTTDTIYSQQCFSRLLLACNLYRYLDDYWKSHGKIYLQRTLAYENKKTSCRRRPLKRKTVDSNDDCQSDNQIFSKSPKRFKCDNQIRKSSPRGNAVGSPPPATSHDACNGLKADVADKEVTMRLVLKHVGDSSNVRGTIDIEVYLIKCNGTISNNYKDVKIRAVASLQLPRNPVTNGAVGESVSSITLGFDAPDFLNGRNSRTRWLLFRSKIPVPHQGKRQLRDSAQRRASASCAPMALEYCYGCLEVNSQIVPCGSRPTVITLYLKPLQAHDTADGNTNGKPVNGHFDGNIFNQLLSECDSETIDFSSWPFIKFSITCQLQNRSQTDVGDVRMRLLRQAYVDGICSRLPYQTSILDSHKECSTPSSDSTSIIYQFYVEHSNQISANRLTTVLKDSNRCPFCRIYATDLYALLQHHRTCHSRLTSVLKETPDGFVVEIRPMVFYDGRIEIQPVCRKRISKRKAQSRKNAQVATKIIFFRRSKTLHINGCRSLDEFKTFPKESDSHENKFRSTASIHFTRIYYHSQTCQTLLSEEFENDSEEELDPEWLRDKTEHLIDEFTDVNEGEKSIMKLWNLHIMKKNYFGDRRMLDACDSFLNTYGRRIVLEELSKNFQLHVANLHSYGLLAQSEVFTLTRKLQSIKPDVKVARCAVRKPNENPRIL